MSNRKLVQFIVFLALLVVTPLIVIGKEQTSTQIYPNNVMLTSGTEREGHEAGRPQIKQVMLRLLDSENKPVGGAKVGTRVDVKDVQVLDSKLIWHLRRSGGQVSDEWGEVLIREEDLFWPSEQRTTLYILHEEHQIGAIVEVSREDAHQGIPVKLVPVCRVYGRLSSKDLDEVGKQLKSTNVDFGPNRFISYHSKQKRFEFFVPPSTYELMAIGSNTKYYTKCVERLIEVSPGISELDLGVIDLPLTVISSLIGKPALEIGPIREWSNGEAVQLADLKGKVVILHFGGQYPSTSRDLPQLARLHDLFADKGLVIIAIYNFESMFQLREKLYENSSKYGGVADVPFRLAIDGGEGQYIKDIYVPGATHAT
jgi:hypothetical protein